MKTLINYLTVLLIAVFTSNVMAQQTVSGTVTTADGPLPGATIVVKGTNTGTTTDFDGNFSIEASAGDVLVASFVGYATQESSVDSSSQIDFVLQEDQLLDEVVITALGISREKKSLGYAVTEVAGDNVNTVKDHNLANSLAGKVAGLQVSQSGSLGAGSRVTIRGNNSLSGNTQALIVVDGMPINSSGINSGSNDDGGTPSYKPNITGGGITDINPDDVESISVLKGPSAAALYGSRAGNGVILITTKKGSTSKRLGVTVKTNLSVDNPMFLPEYQNQYGQGTLGGTFTNPRYDRDSNGNIILDADGNPKFANAWEPGSWGGRLDGSQAPYYDETTKAYNAQPNNVEDFFRQATRAITSLTLDKGFDKGSVRFSYTNNSTESVLENSDLNSHNFNLRAVANLSDKLSIDTKATYFTQEVKNRAGTGAEGLLQYVYTMPRNVAVDDLRNYQMKNPVTPADYRVIRYADGVWGNPYWMLYNDEANERRSRFLGFSKINYQFTDWLSAFVRIGTDVTNIKYSNIHKPGHHFYSLGNMQVSDDTYRELNSEFLITAKRDISEKLNLVANLGGNLSKRTSEGFALSGSDFKLLTKYFINNLATVDAPVFRPRAIKKVNSLYGSINLAYDNFLYIDFSSRNDWSSTLSADNRSYLYNSASLSAILNRFIDPNQDLFNFIKVRASIAEVGNDTDPFQLYQTFNLPGQGIFGLTTVSSPSTKLNPDLKPEKVTSTEFGLELSMLDNKLNLDVSVYDITTTDLIFNVPVPASTGFTLAKDNIGKVTNKGVEVALGASLLDSGDLTWDTSLFYSKNDNKVVELLDGLDSFVYNGSTDGGVAIKAVEGGSIGDIYGKVYTGEVNADGIPIASAQPSELLGNAQPDWLGGWSNSLSYKNFTMSFLIDARIGGKIYSQTSADLDEYGVSKRSLQYRDTGVVVDGNVADTGEKNAKSISAEEYWGAMSDISDNYVYDQDNVRLRELTLGYRIPGTESLGIQSASIQLVGRNLFFLSKSAEDIDPETMLGTTLGLQGISQNPMPTLRSIGLNLTLNF